MAYTPHGWTKPTKKTRRDGVQIVRIAGRNYSRANFATIEGRERECLFTLDELWDKFLKPAQNLTIARELNKKGFIGIEDGWRWIVRLGNLDRAKAWVEEGRKKRAEARGH